MNNFDLTVLNIGDTQAGQKESLYFFFFYIVEFVQ